MNAVRITIIINFVGTIAAAGNFGTPNATHRIVNGRDAQPGDIPYQISLRLNGMHICGGSVLSQKWSITAAHCVDRLEHQPSFFTVRAGSNSRTHGGIILKLKSIIKHPSYNLNTLNFDVALLQMLPNSGANSVIRSKLMTPIQLITNNRNLPTGMDAIVSGWGQISSSNKTLQRILKYAHVYVYDQAKCKKQLEDHGIVSEVMFCAAARSHDACEGDSGGPIQSNGVLIGLVSWGVGCADPDYPGVYTKLSHPGVRTWIRVVSKL